MELELSNFKQHKSQKIDLNGHTIMYGSNGTGKTSFIEALELFFSNTHMIFRDLILNSEDVEIKKLFEGYLENQTYKHENMKWKTYSQKRGKFSIDFTFNFDSKEYSLGKKYDKDGNVNIFTDIDLDNVGVIKEFFKYSFIYYKKNFYEGPLSKGEYAIDYMLESIENIKKNVKDMKKIKIESNNYLLIAFDEPDNKIHPVVWKEIYNKVLELKVNILISTTNLFTIENFLEKKDTSVYYFEKSATLNENTTIIQKIDIEDKNVVELDSEDNQVKKVVGKYLNIEYSSLKDILPVKKYIFVEGESDRQFISLLLKDMNYGDIEVISIDGQDKSISEKYLKPILSFISTIQNFTPNIYCIFDFDSEGYKYRTYFEKYVNIENIFFINGSKYSDVSDEWNDSNKKFTLENHLFQKFRIERQYVTLSEEKIKTKLLNRIEHFENNEFRFECREEKDEFLKRFQEFLDDEISSERQKISQVKKIKNKSKNLFITKAGVRKINYDNFSKKDLSRLKKTIKYLIGDSKRPYELLIKQYTVVKIDKLKNLKKSLQIPDYVLKIHSKSISFYRDYNFMKYNSLSSEGLLSPDIKELLELLNEEES